MPSRRDILKATGGLVLATGGSWLASHAHAADAVPRPAELPGACSPRRFSKNTPDFQKSIPVWKAMDENTIADADPREIVDCLSNNDGAP